MDVKEIEEIKERWNMKYVIPNNEADIHALNDIAKLIAEAERLQHENQNLTADVKDNAHYRAEAVEHLNEVERLQAELDRAKEVAAEVDRAGGDVPHEPCMGLANWIKCRSQMADKLQAELDRVQEEYKNYIKQNTCLRCGYPVKHYPSEVDRLEKENARLRSELEQKEQRVRELEEMYQTTLANHTHNIKAIMDSGYDISPCMSCGKSIVCVPDGLPMCDSCAELNQAEQEG